MDEDDAAAAAADGGGEEEEEDDDDEDDDDDDDDDEDVNDPSSSSAHMPSTVTPSHCARGLAVPQLSRRTPRPSASAASRSIFMSRSLRFLLAVRSRRLASRSPSLALRGESATSCRCCSSMARTSPPSSVKLSVGARSPLLR